MPKNDRRAAADAGTFNIANYPVRGSFIGLPSYAQVNTPTADCHNSLRSVAEQGSLADLSR